MVLILDGNFLQSDLQNCLSSCGGGQRSLYGKCYLTQPNAFYPDQFTTTLYQPCDKSCWQCQGPTTAQCTQCISQRFMDYATVGAGYCVITCPVGKYVRF
jgi:hypothetical protein